MHAKLQKPNTLKMKEIIPFPAQTEGALSHSSDFIFTFTLKVISDIQKIAMYQWFQHYDSRKKGTEVNGKQNKMQHRQKLIVIKAFFVFFFKDK